MPATHTSTPRPLRLLYIEQYEEDALAIEEVLQPQMALHRATSLATAWSLLRERRFEAVLVDQDLPEEHNDSLLEFLRRAAVEIPVVVYTACAVEEVALEMMKAGASDCIRKTKDQQHLSRLPAALRSAVERHLRAQQEREHIRTREQTRMLKRLRASVAKVTHDINNPLAIISGNAQLLIELGRYMELDDEIIKPIKDIEEASTRIATSLKKLSDLKEVMLQEMAQGDGSIMDIDEEMFNPSTDARLSGTPSQTSA